MATNSDYKRARSRRLIVSDQMFLKGMYNTKHVVPMGYAGTVINYEYSHDGLYLEPRKGINTFTEVARYDGIADITYSGNAYYDTSTGIEVVRLIEEDEPVNLVPYKDGEMHGGAYSIVTNYVGLAGFEFDGNAFSYEDILFSFGVPVTEIPTSEDMGLSNNYFDYINIDLGSNDAYYVFDTWIKEYQEGVAWDNLPDIIRAPYGWFDLISADSIRPLICGFNEGSTEGIGLVKATKVDEGPSHGVLTKPMYARLDNNLYVIASAGPLKLTKKPSVSGGDFLEPEEINPLALSYIAFEPDNFEVPGTIPDCVINSVKRTDVPIEVPSYNTAVSTGWNMLSADPFNVGNIAGILNILGIVPYDSSGTEIRFGSIPSEDLVYKGYFYYQGTTAYKYKWEVIDAQGNSTTLVDWSSVSTNTEPVTLSYAPPYNQYQIRLSMREGDDATTEVVSITPLLYTSNDLNLRSKNPINFDLTTANGMFSYKELIGLYGVNGATSTIFFSDIGNPGYFPFPNNVAEFNDKILAVKALRDVVIVLCDNSLHTLSGGPLVTEFQQEVLRENFNMDPLDAHMAMVIKDAIFFRANNAFYWLSPNRYSDNEADLIDVKVSDPIEDLLSMPEETIYPIIKRMYDVELTGEFTILDGDSFTDKEKIHMTYKCKAADTPEVFLLDLVYSTATRQWTVEVSFDDRSISVYKPSTREYHYCTTGDSVFTTYDTALGTTAGMKSHHYGFLSDKYQADVSLLLAGEGVEASSTGTVINPESDGAYAVPNLEDYSGYTTGTAITTYFDAPIHNNFQFMDTGIIALQPDIVKRFRELQFTFYNKDGDAISNGEQAVRDYIAAGDFDFPDVDPADLDDYTEEITEYFTADPLKFYADFTVDGRVQTSGVTYEIKQVTDTGSPDYGKIYVERTEQSNMETTVLVPGETRLDSWELDFSQFPDLDLAKLRIPTQGKGRYPSMTLLQKSSKGYNYIDYAVVYRIMNSR